MRKSMNRETRTEEELAMGDAREELDAAVREKLEAAGAIIPDYDADAVSRAAGAEAQKIVAQMAKEELERQARKRKGQKVGPVSSYYAARTRADSSVIADPDTGLNMVPPGHIARHVRMNGPDGKPSAQRVAELRHAGYQPILNSEGKQVIGPLGLAMSAPIAVEAKRVALSIAQAQPPEMAEGVNIEVTEETRAWDPDRFEARGTRMVE